MPTFGNILARKGGTAMTGKEVTLSLAIPAPKDGKPFVETAVVLLLPVSEARKSAAFRAADAYVAECERVASETGQPSTAPSIKDERALRFLCESMRDASDARKFFVESERINDFRDVVIAEQIRLLLSEYDQLILDEYAEVRTKQELLEMKAQALATFQPGQG
ncbi:MAG: hypothetical protein E6Q97_34465 [Desulfurellales bacterium]|nr:MAG: hypothetical protein E6Q97_34465 [Desulfurellales bacterium]